MSLEFENHRTELPSPEWVANSLSKTVRLNNGIVKQLHIPEFRTLAKEEIDGFQVSSFGQDVISPVDNEPDVSERILSILLNSNIRKGSLQLVKPYIPLLRQKISSKTRHADPVEIVLPTLPFKDQNPLTTRHSLERVDLGEYLFMAQMRDIASSVERTYPPGVRIALLTDGLVYVDIFANGEKDKINKYRENCVKIRDDFGLEGNVEILDMMDLVVQQDQFLTTQEEIKNIIFALSRISDDVQLSLAALRKGMLLNIPASQYSFDEYRSIVDLPEESLPSDVLGRITDASFDYASFLLAMRYLDVIHKAFPSAIRATVHPKDAPQLPIHLANKSSAIFPYNGIPLVSERRLHSTGSLRRSTRIVRFYEALQYPDAKAVHIDRQDEPFYYLFSDSNNGKFI